MSSEATVAVYIATIIAIAISVHLVLTHEDQVNPNNPQ